MYSPAFTPSLLVVRADIAQICIPNKRRAETSTTVAENRLVAGRYLRSYYLISQRPYHWEQNMADQNDVDLDSIIDRLLEVRGSRPGKQVQLLEAEIRYLCTKAREIFISQPILLELEAPIKANNFSSTSYSV